MYHLTGSARPEDRGDPVKKRQSGRERVRARKRSRELATHVATALETHLSTEGMHVQRDENLSAQRYVHEDSCVTTEVANGVLLIAAATKEAASALLESPRVTIEKMAAAGAALARVVDFQAGERKTNVARAISPYSRKEGA